MTHSLSVTAKNQTGADPDAIAEAFARDGFYLARGLCDAATTASLATDFDRIVHQLETSGEDIDAGWQTGKALAPGTSVVHTHNVHRFSSHWSRFPFDERFLAVASAILGPDVVLHHSKLFQKPPRTGAPFPMHQDWSYFPFRKDSMIAAIVHVSAATDDMGCVRVVPGSHRLGRVQGSGGQGDGSDTRWQAFHAEHPFEEALPIEAEPGDVLFFHYFTVHGSRPNTSDATRKTVLFQMHAGGDEPDAGGRHPYAGVTLRGFNTAARRHASG